MTAMQWLILIVAVVILAPLVPWALRRRDFAHQVRGSRPERKPTGRERPDVPGGAPNAAAESLALEAKMKSVQNAMGPR